VVESQTYNEIYNISGSIELANKEVIKKILNIYHGENKDHCWQDYIVDSERQGQDVRYSIDDSKLRALGWRPQQDFDLALTHIVDHYRSNFVW